jgi:hypothetical protein
LVINEKPKNQGASIQKKKLFFIIAKTIKKTPNNNKNEAW